MRGITDDDILRLGARGIRTINQLLHRTTLKIDREKLARKTGISEARLLGLGRQAQLWEISGIDRFFPALWRLGITSQKDLRVQDADELHRRLLQAVGLAGAPTLSDVQYWIGQSRVIDVLEDEEEPSAVQTSPDIQTRPRAADTMRLIG
jgi:hypothetical protein